MKLSFDELNKTELRVLLDHHRQMVRGLERVEAKDLNCKGCVHGKPLVEGGVHCTKYQSSPPPDVQSVGCDEWSWDSIPF